MKPYYNFWKIKNIKQYIKLLIEVYRFSKVDLILSFLLFHVSVIFNIPKIYNSKKKLNKSVLISEAGFGHTIHDVEIIKFALNKNFLILILSEHNRHNWSLRHIWKDIDVLYIRKTAPFFSQSTQSIMQKYCTFFLYKIYSLINTDLIELDNNFNTKYLKKDNSVISKLISKASNYNDYNYQKPDDEIRRANLSYPNQYEAYYAYFFLRNKLDSNMINLPKKLNENFKNILYKYNYKNKKIVNIYLRQKGRDNRCGSSIKVWSEVIRFLVDNNFFVYITGDVNISKFPVEIRSKLYSANKFKINKNLFSIFAPYHCDYYLSEMGGGVWFGMIFKKPTLMVNCWQYWGVGGSNFYLLFKNLIDQKTNKYIPFKKAIKKYFWTNDIPKNTILENNNASQIIQGFKDLLKGEKFMPMQEVDSKFEYSWAKISKTILVSSNKF